MPENSSTKRVVYRGPAQQSCYQLAEHGYPALLVPDRVYELPADFADALLASNAYFDPAPPSVSFGKKPAGEAAEASAEPGEPDTDDPKES